MKVYLRRGQHLRRSPALEARGVIAVARLIAIVVIAGVGWPAGNGSAVAQGMLTQLDLVWPGPP